MSLRKAWGMARADMPAILSNPDVLDKLVIWRTHHPLCRDPNEKGVHMPQKQWTIEARADFADQEKNDMITDAVRRAAVHINATLQLLSDGQKPQVVVFSDDHFKGHEDIALLEDTIGQAIAAHAAEMGEAEAPSAEMMQAMRDVFGEK